MAKRFLTIFLGLALSVIGLEVGIRIFQLVIPGYSPGVQFSAFDPELGWHHLRKTEGQYRGPDFDSHVRINRWGLRGKDMKKEKADPQTVRILFLGDSVTAGFEVEERITFAAQTERLLNICAAGRVRFEAINAGVRGYGTDQSLLYYEREGKKLGASIVVYTLVQNDIFENVQRTGLGRSYPKPRFLFDGDRLSLEKVHSPGQSAAAGTLDLIKRYLRRHSRVYGWTVSRIGRLGKRGPDWIPEIFSEYANSKKSGERAVLFRALMKRLRDAVSAEGAQLIVMINPAKFEIDRARLNRLLALRVPEDQLKKAHLDPDAFHERYRAIVRELGIPVVETLPAFRKAVQEKKKLYVRDGHPNAKGHALLAWLLMDKITSERLIPLSSSAEERCLLGGSQLIAAEPKTQKE